MIADYTVVPPSPGAALARLSEIAGLLRRENALLAPLQKELAGQTDSLLQSRTALETALESGQPESVQTALRDAQAALRRVYETASQPGLWSAEDAPQAFQLLNFPDPLQPDTVHPVDVSRVSVTFALRGRQVLTTMAFPEAPGATHYFLIELRSIDDEIVEDYKVDNNAPLFARVRIPAGKRQFRIQSRDTSQIAISGIFDVTIPESLD